MKSSVHVSLAVLVVGSLLAFAGCSDDDAGDDTAAGGASAQGIGGASADALECEVLGELCHEVDDGNGPLHDCHELGHIGNAGKCAAGFDDCATRCLAARAALEADSGGGSGAGGAPAGGESGRAGATDTSAAGTAGSGD